ncbi:MAG: rhomboid family intramembrane serine protease [Bacteroidota bacterium]|nr:rhomboid family intramembrane serine protease [Bacteroidota bacterium]
MFNAKRDFLQGIPPVTKNLIIINLLCWLASITLPSILRNSLGEPIDISYWLGLHYMQAPDFRPYQMVTYMFMHAGFTHLFFNMFAVYMFGRIVESTWGPKRFLIFYTITGIGAAIVQQITWFMSIGASFSEIAAYGGMLNGMITIGASGAVFGILLAFAMLYPNAPLFLMFIPVPIKAKYMMIVYGIIELTSGVYNSASDNVAHFAHLGGMLFGYFLVRYWKQKDNQNGRFFF